MAKDGTNRGGRRVRAGGKPKATYEKIAAGEGVSIMSISDLEGTELENTADLDGVSVPEPDDYLKAKQKDGSCLYSEKIYKETWLWLRERNCENLVNSRLLESYSQAFARFIQCENAISKFGLLGRHPTTGAAVANPFVTMSQSFQKQANTLWYEIFDIVRQNCTKPFSGDVHVDLMESLLSGDN